jgi:hypothetical protein
MTSISTRGIAAAAAAACIAIAASPAALAYSPPATTRSDSAQSGNAADGIASRVRMRSALAQERYYSSYANPDKSKSTYPPAGFRGGDSPVDHPGAARAQPVPTTVEVVRPERTIVRDVDQLLPIALSATALFLALAMLGIALVRIRLVPRSR